MDASLSGRRTRPLCRTRDRTYVFLVTYNPIVLCDSKLGSQVPLRPWNIPVNFSQPLSTEIRQDQAGPLGTSLADLSRHGQRNHLKNHQSKGLHLSLPSFSSTVSPPESGVAVAEDQPRNLGSWSRSRANPGPRNNSRMISTHTTAASFIVGLLCRDLGPKVNFLLRSE